MNGISISARFWILVTLFALLPTVDGADSELLSPGLVVNPGFCVNAVEHTTVWPGSRRPEGLSTWGSICQTGDDQGRLETQEFVAPSTLNLYLAGYVGLPGLRLLLRNVQSGEETELRPQALPRQTWQQNNFPVPQAWIGKPVQLTAEQGSPSGRHWAGSASACQFFQHPPSCHPSTRICRRTGLCQWRFSRVARNGRMISRLQASAHLGFILQSLAMRICQGPHRQPHGRLVYEPLHCGLPGHTRHPPGGREHASWAPVSP